jgi:hypothetical protein
MVIINVNIINYILALSFDKIIRNLSLGKRVILLDFYKPPPSQSRYAGSGESLPLRGTGKGVDGIVSCSRKLVDREK